MLDLLGFCVERERPMVRDLPEVLVTLSPRLLRLTARFRALVAKIRAGTNTPPRQRETVPQDAATRDATQAPPEPAAPGFPVAGPADPDPWPARLSQPVRPPGWLTWLMEPTVNFHHMTDYSDQIRQALTDPEMLAMLAAEPRLGRLLRPLWRILFHQPLPPELALPRRPRRRKPGPEPSPEPDPEPELERWPTHDEVFGPPENPLFRNMRRSIKVPGIHCPLKRPPKRRRRSARA